MPRIRAASVFRNIPQSRRGTGEPRHRHQRHRLPFANDQRTGGRLHSGPAPLCLTDARQCSPLYTYGPDGTHRRDNITGWALERSRTYYGNPCITRCRIFHYVYGILHQAGYRERFAQNLKLALPRIPFAPDFDAFAYAGEELARLHLDYEKLEPYPLRFIETPGAVLRYEVHDKMRLARDRASLAVNPTLTLAGIPHEAFDYRLGNRSAIEWVVDQYQVTEDPRSGIRSDPNRPEDPQYIVRLAGQVIRLSLETVRIVKNLPATWS